MLRPGRGCRPGRILESCDPQARVWWGQSHADFEERSPRFVEFVLTQNIAEFSEILRARATPRGWSAEKEP